MGSSFPSDGSIRDNGIIYVNTDHCADHNMVGSIKAHMRQANPLNMSALKMDQTFLDAWWHDLSTAVLVSEHRAVPGASSSR